MRRKKVTQKEIVTGLRRLAFGEVNGAVTLLFEPEESLLQKLDGLDLFNVSEIKRQKGGGMEIKFFDRLKAIERLDEYAKGAGTSNAPTSFFDALEKSATSATEVYEEEANE